MRPPLSAATILLVDDDEDIRKNATLILDLEGYQVVSASNGQEALDMLTSAQVMPALIVSDIAMPRLDGYAFFQAVRQIPALRLVPFIFLSAHGSRRHMRFGRELGVDDYLVKPFDPVELLATVRNKLHRNQELREQVESEFDAARRALVQLLSHELRTPLTYITGGFELLADSLRKDSSTQDVDVSVGLIRSGTHRLTRLAEQVVRYTELVSGHAEAQLHKVGEPVHVAAILDSAIAMAEADLANHPTALNVDLRVPDDAEIYTVPELLTTALFEIIRNAIAYGNDNNRVSVLSYLDDQYIVVEVQDLGRGIAFEDQARIWEIMQQSERNKHEQQGAGMGLPIVKQTVELHGGDVALRSEPGVGTTVRLRLPRYKA